ncbi:MFS transporter, SP family [Dictyocaulus viviparus]|uniref:MFS transporter, SP family n=1 Tax=Dictyocaulus viviparus TaxID=29172 RepID=A0A0D8XXR7_DICVI|nr:MFS transporter, SP family [Dictyocaulus viviparus]
MIMANEDEKGRVPVVAMTTKTGGTASDDEKGALLAKEKEAAQKLNPPKTVGEGHMTSALAFAVFSVTLGSFQFGYHIGCVNAPGEIITGWIQESHQRLFNQTLEKPEADLTWSVAVSMFAIGGMFGGLISGWLADKVGRRGGLLYNNLFAFIAAAMMGLAKPIGVYPLIVLGRLLIGFYCGLTCIVPMYLAETSPTNLRGMLGSLHQLLITVSILTSQIFGLPYFMGNIKRWPLIFAFTVVPAVIQVITLPMIPESPKYTLCVRGQPDKAAKDLKKLRGVNDVSAELETFREEAAATGSNVQERPSMADMFRGSLLWPMTIAIMMMLAQQLSGINVAMFYSTVIFKQAGLSEEDAVYATIGMGTVNVIMTIVSVWLVDHPKFGRRSLMLIGMIGMWFSTILLVAALSLSVQGHKWASYGAIIFVLLFVISFATGPGSIPWFFVSEIFASSARGNANSIAVMVNWTANLIVGLTFLSLNNALAQYSFLVFTGFLSFFIFFTHRFVPETKGKTVEEVTASYHRRAR